MANIMTCCPKCGKQALYLAKRGASLGAAAAGMAAMTLVGQPLLGAAAGLVGYDKLIARCANCGAKYRLVK
jgi:predicted RNA-binding Zn-ribbon protein involved in translation (DUF1610 family)